MSDVGGLRHDDGRLELDAAGAVVGGSVPLDLSDPTATEALSPTALDTWAATRLSPRLGQHRRAAAAVAATAVAGVLLATWWSSRPVPPTTPAPVRLADAPVSGADLGGPQIGSDGRLSVAYAVHSDGGLAQAEVIGLRGPGLDPLGVEAGALSVPGGHEAFVQLGAALQCADPRLTAATASSYGVLVRARHRDGSVHDALVALGSGTSDLGAAVRDACLADDLVSRLSVASAHLVGPGPALTGLAVVVRNGSALPLTVSTARTPGSAVEADLSPDVEVPPHGSATITTRLLVHDCAAPSGPDGLAALPNPVSEAGAPETDAAGLLLRVALGPQWRLASYALPWTVPQLRSRLAAAVCSGHPTVTARLVGVRGARTSDGGWLVTGGYDVVTTGIDVRVGREDFTGTADDAGSLLQYHDQPVPGLRASPSPLGGGAGRILVVVQGTSCEDVRLPTVLPLWVTAADGDVYPIESPLDAATLAHGVSAACTTAAAGTETGPAVGGRPATQTLAPVAVTTNP